LAGAGGRQRREQARIELGELTKLGNPQATAAQSKWLEGSEDMANLYLLRTSYDVQRWTV
jgi:hypothetical protein